MNTARITIRPLASNESIVALAPLISALKNAQPNTQVGILAEEIFREASLLLPNLDFFTSDDLVDACQIIDLRGNETYEQSIESIDWKSYLRAANYLELGNPYHVIDLLRKVGKVDSIDVNFELAKPNTDEQLPDALLSPGGLRVGICTSSLSQDAIDASLMALSQLAIATEVFFLGTVKDKRVTTGLLPKWDGKLAIHDLCGKQSLIANAAVLRNCDIVLAGPGLNSLVSSGYGTFTVCIDNNPQRGPLLYPYGHGHLVIQQATGEDTVAILPELIRDIFEYALNGNAGSVPTLDQWQSFADSKIEPYLGKVRLMATQRIEVVLKGESAGTRVTEFYLRPLLFLGSESFDTMQTFYRLMWEHSLNQRSITTFDLQVLHQNTVSQLCELLKPLEQLYELANFGRTYSGYVRDSLAKDNLPRAKQESAQLQEVEELVHNLGSAQKTIFPLCAYHRERQLLLASENPIELADEMALLFNGMQERVLVLLDLAKSLFHTTFLKETATEAGTSSEEGLFNG